MGLPRDTLLAFSHNRQAVLERCKVWPHRQAHLHHPRGGQGAVEVEQLIGSIKEDQLKIQNLESGMRGLKSDLEEKVLNNEKLNTALALSKSLVNSLNTKYNEAMEQVTKSVKTLAEHDKTSKALKSAKEEIVRLTKKSDEPLKTISKLRATTVPQKKFDKAYQLRYHLENKLKEKSGQSKSCRRGGC